MINLKTKIPLYSGPEFLFARILHLPLALRTSRHVPDAYAVAATLRTQAARLAPVRRSHIANDAAHNDVLHAVAVGARHGRDVLPKQSATRIYFGLVSARPALVFLYPGHLYVFCSLVVWLLVVFLNDQTTCFLNDQRYKGTAFSEIKSVEEIYLYSFM